MEPRDEVLIGAGLLATACAVVVATARLLWRRPGQRRDDVDLIVVGFGAGGGCSALSAVDEARRAGTLTPDFRVVILERYNGGGATCRSGGIVYAGGGTATQRALGIEDTPRDMFNYLKEEVAGAVTDEALQDFVDSSVENLRWLRDDHGLPVDLADKALLCPLKSGGVPPPPYTLMESGSEYAAPFVHKAAAAPRGHLAVGKASYQAKTLWAGTGAGFFEGLQRAVENLAPNIEVRLQSRVESLIQDPASGRVVGCHVVSLEHAFWPARLLHQFVGGLGSEVLPLPLDPLTRGVSRLLEALFASRYSMRTANGVVLAAGGYSRNPELMAQHCPEYVKGLPLGGAGDDGAGLRLGLSAGGRSACLHNAGGYKFIYPPTALLKGIFVTPEGKRNQNEDVYGARLTSACMVRSNGRGFLILDAKLFEAAKAHLWSGDHMLGYQKVGFPSLVFFFFFFFFSIWPPFFFSSPFHACTHPHTLTTAQMFAIHNVYYNSCKAANIRALARKIGVNADALADTVDRYNAAVTSSKPHDPEFDKQPKYLAPLSTAPFYAIDYGIDASLSWLLWPTPYLTLGGLVVDAKSGLVERKDGKGTVAGLYAAGRNAVGIPSTSYVSGLSIADCIWSGRRAGTHAIRHGGS